MLISIFKYMNFFFFYLFSHIFPNSMSINTVPVKSRILEIAMDTPNFHSIITTYRKWFKIHQFFFHPACHTFSNSIFRGAPGAPLPPIKLEKIWFFTRNTPKMFAPPSARRNFFKCSPTPPNLKSRIRTWYLSILKEWKPKICPINFFPWN